MKRSTLFVAVGVVFAVGIALGAISGDIARDDGSGPGEVPVASPEPVPMLPGVVVPPDTGVPSFSSDSPFVPIEVAAEFAAIDVPEPTSGGSIGTTTTVAPGEELGGPGDASLEGRGYPWELEDLADVSVIDLLFGDAGFPFYRFLDFCADTPDDPSCPPGTGGTVLAPFDDPVGPIGDFNLRNVLYSSRSGWWSCAPPSGLGDTEYLLLLSATHPARMEIDWYPVDDPADLHTTIVDHTDPGGRVFTDFLEELATTGRPPATGVHHCFVLDAERRSQTYRIEVEATSFTGETDSDTFSFTSGELRRRPPITIAPLSDYEATVAVPVTSDPRQYSLVRLINTEEVGLDGISPDCAAIEDDVFEHRRSDVVLWTSGAPFSGFYRHEAMGRDIVEAPDWRYDPAYDAYDFWTLNLEEGNTYRVCIWWLGSGARSFDPAFAAVVDRETRWLATPDRLRVEVRVAGVVAPTSRDVAASAFGVHAASCGSVALPTTGLARDTGIHYAGGLPLCDYRGYAQPALTQIRVLFDDHTTKEFLIATPNTGEPRTEQVRLDLSQVRTTGLCGGSFGECDPPTATVPGPQVFLDVIFSSGVVNGRSDWERGAPLAFDPPDRAPRTLSEQIQIDTHSSRVDAADRHSLRVTATFDRPVTIHASIEGDRSGQCFVDAAPEYSSETAAPVHSFVLGGLCILTQYSVRLDATDAAGSVRAFRDSPDFGDGYWQGWGFTDGHHVSFQVNYLAGLVEDYATGTFLVEVAGVSMSLVEDDRCLVTRTTSFQDGVWGDEVTVEIFVTIDGARRTAGVCSRVPYTGSWQASVTATFTIDQFRAGRIAIPVLLEDVSGRPGPGAGALSVVIQGLVLP